jgi:hypothetical protein
MGKISHFSLFFDCLFFFLPNKKFFGGPDASRAIFQKSPLAAGGKNKKNFKNFPVQGSYMLSPGKWLLTTTKKSRLK